MIALKSLCTRHWDCNHAHHRLSIIVSCLELRALSFLTLELERAQLVEEINTQIKTRKNRLAPQIRDLRALRTKFQAPPPSCLVPKHGYLGG